MRTVSQRCGSPIYQLAVPALSSADSFRLAAVSLKLQSKTSIDVLQIGASELDTKDYVDVKRLYTIESSFPPSAVQFAASKVHRYQDTVCVSGEALAIWRDGEVIAFHAPPTATTTGKSPAWAFLHTEWSEYKPEAILACQNNGQLCIYPVERLNNSLQADTGEPRGFLSRLFNTATRRQSHPGPSSQVALMPYNGSIAPNVPCCDVLQQCSPNRTYTCAKFVGDHQIVATRSDNDQIALIDIRSPAPRQAENWTATNLAPTKIIADPFLHPNLICTLDRQNAVVTLWDKRSLDAPIKHLNSQQLTGYDCLINDVWWEPGYQEKSTATNGLLYVACQPRIQSSAPVPLIQTINVVTLAAPNIPHCLTSWGEPSPPSLTKISAALTVATVDDAFAIYTTAVYDPATRQSLPPTPYHEEVMQTEEFYEASSWELHIASLKSQPVPRRGSVCTRGDLTLDDDGCDSSVAVVPSDTHSTSSIAAQ